MGKHEAGSAKAIANAQKARGLQKLRFYCQVCEKQCRDENGIKCHKLTEGHLRKMQLFRSNASHFVRDFSKRFKNGFLDILSRRHNTKRVSANVVYNEYIQDRDHVHMNATQWTSLTQFVQHLAEENLVVADETELGIYVRWLDRGNERIMGRLNNSGNGKRPVIDDEDRRRRDLDKQIKLAQALEQDSKISSSSATSEPVFTDPTSGQNLIKGGLVSFKKKSLKRPRPGTISEIDDDDDDDDDDENGDDGEQKRVPTSKPSLENSKAAAAAIMQREVAKHDESSTNSKIDHAQKTYDITPGTWLVPGLVVKIISNSLVNRQGKSYKKRKGVVQSVEQSSTSGKGIASVRMLDADGDLVQAKDSQLETVLPDLGQPVLLVSHTSSFKYRGMRAKLVDIDLERFKASAKLLDGETVRVEYENICKIHLKP